MMSNLRIATLALQGAFAEHEQMLRSLGAESVEIRNLNDWLTYAENPQGLIIPGGESTTMTRIMHDLELWDPIRDAIAGGLPVFGTCAGLIMLDSLHLATMDITAKRNAYGRQLGSFYHEGSFNGITDDGSTIPMTFIRAPYIETAGKDVEILSVVNDRIVAARQGNQLVTAFHPELNTDTHIHRFFLDIVEKSI